MATIAEMRQAVGNNVEVILNSGKIFRGMCTDYNWPEDDDEKHNITINQYGGYFELNVDEIESIIILDD